MDTSQIPCRQRHPEVMASELREGLNFHTAHPSNDKGQGRLSHSQAVSRMKKDTRENKHLKLQHLEDLRQLTGTDTSEAKGKFKDENTASFSDTERETGLIQGQYKYLGFQSFLVHIRM